MRNVLIGSRLCGAKQLVNALKSEPVVPSNRKRRSSLGFLDVSKGFRWRNPCQRLLCETCPQSGTKPNANVIAREEVPSPCIHIDPSSNPMTKDAQFQPVSWFEPVPVQL